MRERQLVYLVRHGQTAWAASMRHTGHTDIPLTDEGKQEAAVLRHVFQDVDFDLVLSSPLQRALETCRIAGLAERVRTTPDLMEWDYGDYEGKTTAEIRNRVPGWTVFTHPCPGGETIDQVSGRADRVIAEIRQVNGITAVFAHGHLLRVLAARWLGLESGHGRFLALGTGTLSVIGYDSRNSVIKTWNGPLLTAACALSHIAKESEMNRKKTP